MTKLFFCSTWHRSKDTWEPLISLPCATVWELVPLLMYPRAPNYYKNAENQFYSRDLLWNLILKTKIFQKWTLKKPLTFIENVKVYWTSFRLMLILNI